MKKIVLGERNPAGNPTEDRQGTPWAHAGFATGRRLGPRDPLSSGTSAEPTCVFVGLLVLTSIPIRHQSRWTRGVMPENLHAHAAAAINQMGQLHKPGSKQDTRTTTAKLLCPLDSPP